MGQWEAQCKKFYRTGFFNVGALHATPQMALAQTASGLGSGEQLHNAVLAAAIGAGGG